MKLLVFINVPFLVFTRKGTGRTCGNQFFLLQFASDTKTLRIALTMMIYIKNFFTLLVMFFFNESKCAKEDTVPAHILFSHKQYRT